MNLFRFGIIHQCTALHVWIWCCWNISVGKNITTVYLWLAWYFILISCTYYINCIGKLRTKAILLRFARKLAIQRSALLEDGASLAGDSNLVAYFIKGIYHIGATACVWTYRGDRVLIPVPIWLLVGTPSAFGPELTYRLRVAQPVLMDFPLYFWYSILLLYVFLYHIFMTSPLWLVFRPQTLYKEDYLQIFKCVSFWLHGCCG